LAQPFDKPSDHVLCNTLQKLGIVDAVSAPRLEPIPRNPERRDYLKRASFRVFSGGRVVCHLTVGKNLADLQTRTRAFAEACAEIACRPLFWHQSEGWDYLGVELFEGQDIEALVRDGRLKPADAIAHVAKVISALERTLLPSAAEAAAQEMEQFFSWVCASPVFSGLDQQFLHSVIFPFIRSGALSGPQHTRWTNGDLIALNVLVDPRGGLRLVDYEFASRTHFYAEDWWRWRSLSKLPPEALDLPGSHMASTEPWLEAYSILRHAVLVHEINGVAVALSGLRPQIDRLVALAAAAHAGFRASVFLQPLALRSSNTSAGPQAGQEGLHAIEAIIARQQRQLQSMTARLHQREDKIARMQRSFSWRSTAPLRWSRRQLLDRRRQVSAPEPLPALYIIESPPMWDAAPASAEIVGWCLYPDGRPVGGIRARIGRDAVFAGTYGLDRKDVAEMYGFIRPDARACGFRIAYQLPVETAQPVALEALGDDNRWHMFAERFLRTGSQPRSVHDSTG
jgi:hypothetical protein